MAAKALFVMSKHVHPSEISTAYCNPSLNCDLATSSKTCDRPQPCLVTTTPELPVPKKDGYAKVPTTNGTITLPVPNDSTSSVISSEGREGGDKTIPSSSQDGSPLKMHPVPSPVHVPAASSIAIADATSTPTPSPNTLLEAATPTSNKATSTAADASESFWQIKMPKVLKYFCTEHPKLVSAVSTVLITVGRIALHPGVAACFGGPTFTQHAVQAVGAGAVAVGKWLRTALNSVTTKAAAQAQLSD